MLVFGVELAFDFVLAAGHDFGLSDSLSPGELKTALRSIRSGFDPDSSYSN